MKDSNFHQKRWSKTELIILLSNKDKTPKELSKMLGRTEQAVYQKLCKVKLVPNKYLTVKELHETNSNSKTTLPKNSIKTVTRTGRVNEDVKEIEEANFYFKTMSIHIVGKTINVNFND